MVVCTPYCRVPHRNNSVKEVEEFPMLIKSGLAWAGSESVRCPERPRWLYYENDSACPYLSVEPRCGDVLCLNWYIIFPSATYSVLPSRGFHKIPKSTRDPLIKDYVLTKAVPEIDIPVNFYCLPNDPRACFMYDYKGNVAGVQISVSSILRSYCLWVLSFM